MSIWAVLTFVVLAAMLIMFFWIAGALIYWFVKLITTPQAWRPSAIGTDDWRNMTGDEEGYVHSGPYGYSPMTAYPQTQYGSGFNPDAEWAERTGFNRDHRDN